ncbi:MAG: M23 family metallopeptidase [Bernardetiaceae bacterium]
MLSTAQVQALSQRLQEHLPPSAINEELIDHLCCLTEENLRTQPWEMAQELAWQDFLATNDLSLLREHVQTTQRAKAWKRLGISGGVLAMLGLFFCVSLTVRAAQTPSLLPIASVAYRWIPERAALYLAVSPDQRLPVCSSGNGQVLEIKADTSAQRYTILIWHNATYQSHYHALSALQVKAGDPVRQGDILGYAHGQPVWYQVKDKGTFINPSSFFTYE